MEKLTKKQEEEIKKFQHDLWEWSKDHGVILREKELKLFMEGWKKAMKIETNSDNLSKP